MQPEPVMHQTEWACGSCTLLNILDLSKSDSATCEACGTEDKQKLKQI